LLIEQKAHGVHQKETHQAIAQMPQVTRPDTFHLAAIRQLIEYRIHEIADAAQNRTLIRCGQRLMRFAKRGLQENPKARATRLANRATSNCDLPARHRCSLPATKGQFLRRLHWQEPKTHAAAPQANPVAHADEIHKRFVDLHDLCHSLLRLGIGHTRGREQNDKQVSAHYRQWTCSGQN